MSAKTLVLYHYFEKDASYRDNLLHFLVFGYLPSLDYVIVIAGNHSLDLPQAPNLRYIFTENQNSDYGGYAHALPTIGDLRQYENIFFINSSVRGPYQLATDHRPWMQIYLALLQPDVGLVGSSICILRADFRHSLNYQEKFGGMPPFSHVQTASFAMSSSTLIYLLAKGFFDPLDLFNKTQAIENYEIRLSQLVLEQGKNLKCLLPEYNTIDFRLAYTDINPTSTIGDPCEALGYFGRNVHPYEVMFIKTNRYLYSNAYLQRLSYSMWQARKADLAVWVDSVPVLSAFVSGLSETSQSKQAVKDFSELADFAVLREEYEKSIAENSYTLQLLATLQSSSSWKITAPLRAIGRFFRRSLQLNERDTP